MAKQKVKYKVFHKLKKSSCGHVTGVCFFLREKVTELTEPASVREHSVKCKQVELPKVNLANSLKSSVWKIPPSRFKRLSSVDSCPQIFTNGINGDWEDRTFLCKIKRYQSCWKPWRKCCCDSICWDSLEAFIHDCGEGFSHESDVHSFCNDCTGRRKYRFYLCLWKFDGEFIIL